MTAACPPCAALVATRNRWDLLVRRSLPSIRRQTLSPSGIILVNDGEPFPADAATHLGNILAPIPLAVLANGRLPGAAGAWNTGLQHLQRIGFAGYVAILDDDDEWDDSHLAATMATARDSGAEVVVSGLRRLVDGQLQPRVLPENLTDRDFLRGNPGWQGSNTVVLLAALSGRAHERNRKVS